MKITHWIAAAGIAVAALGASAPASAQHYGDHRGRDGGYDRHDDRRGGYDRGGYNHGYDRGGYGRHDDRGRHYGRRDGRHCRIEYRHHRQVRVCR